jgi:hypothetical protein
MNAWPPPLVVVMRHLSARTRTDVLLLLDGAREAAERPLPTPLEDDSCIAISPSAPVEHLWSCTGA